MSEQSADAPGGREQQEKRQVVVVGPDGQPVGAVTVNADGTVDTGGDQGERGPADLVEQPAKVMRIGSMVKQLLEEVRAAPLDDAARGRLRDVHGSSIKELADGLAPELQEELERLTSPFSNEVTPSDAELRIAQAQLVGWLEGLFHGIQTAMLAQQMAARAQLEQQARGRPALPGGPHPGPAAPGGAHGTGQYL
jgi:hypothetical protein